MSTEVWRGQPYGPACDVYSFGIMLWEIIVLSRAYDDCTLQDEATFARLVFDDATRPSLDGLSSVNLKSLLKRMWCENQHERVSMSKARSGLQEALLSIQSNESERRSWRTNRRSSNALGCQDFHLREWSGDVLDISKQSYSTSMKLGARL